MSGAQATATGTLGGTPLPNLLIYALDRRLDGTLVIEDPRARKCAVCFRVGAPVKVKLPEPIALLSAVLVEMGALEESTATDLYATAQREGRLFGEVLLERTGVDPTVLGDALGEQLARKLEWLAALPASSVYGYYDGQDYLKEYGGPDGAPSDPLALVWRVLRGTAEAGVVDQTLARVGARDVRLHPRSRVGRFAFDQKERGIVDVLRVKPQPVPSLIATGVLPEAQAKRVLYALIVTRHIDLGAGTTPLGVEGSGSTHRPSGVAFPSTPAPAAPRPVVAPVAAVSASAAELRAEIQRRSQEIGAQNYYEILGVDRTAASGQIQTAFFQLAKKWHPDRIGVEAGDLRDTAMRIFARMTEAHQILSSDEQRREYERLMKEGGASSDEQEEVQRVLRAATSFQKAEVMARRGNLAEAEAQASLAVESDPDQPEYVALYADIMSQKPERAQSGAYKDLVQIVTEAKKRQPNNMRIWLYRGRVLKRAGDLQGAYQEFRAVVEKDVNNVEAAREVRLHQMRKGSKTTDPRKREDGGKGGKKEEKSASKDIGAMFGKLFKR